MHAADPMTWRKTCGSTRCSFTPLSACTQRMHSVLSAFLKESGRDISSLTKSVPDLKVYLTAEQIYSEKCLNIRVIDTLFYRTHTLTNRTTHKQPEHHHLTT